MDPTIDTAKLKVQQWTSAHTQAILYDEENASL
jgi:hypothetical protein